MRLRFMLAAAALVAGTLAVSAASAAPVYMRSTVEQPWGVNTNEDAMDAVFGAGNWDDLRYETADAASVFSGANHFVFMEGGDSNADELETFLTANIAAIEAWVAAGGRLLLNSAPNEGDGMSFGFGVTLNSNCCDDASNPATATDGTHPIFAGPATPVATDYTGSFFAHSIVTGAGLSSILEGDAGTILAEMSVGSGLALFGSMTTDNFHDPQPQAHNLRINIIAYTAGATPPPPPDGDVPEPMTVALLGLGVLGLGALRRRAI